MNDKRSRSEITIEKMSRPRPGYMFTEWFAFYMNVVYVSDDRVVVEEYSAPCEIPTDRKLKRFHSLEEFQKAYAYGSIPGYSVWYVGDDAPTSHVSEDDIRFEDEPRGVEDFGFQDAI